MTHLTGPQPVFPPSWDGLRDIQRFCRENSVAKGFGKEGDDIRYLVGTLPDSTLAESILSSYHSKRLNLIHDELAEAHEELRNGRGMNEQYKNTSPGKEGKPEGVPSELADVVIRVFDLAGEFEIDLAQVISDKLAFNATREKMHGRKF